MRGRHHRLQRLAAAFNVMATALRAELTGLAGQRAGIELAIAEVGRFAESDIATGYLRSSALRRLAGVQSRRGELDLEIAKQQAELMEWCLREKSASSLVKALEVSESRRLEWQRLLELSSSGHHDTACCKPDVIE